jgi:hypothetical protein
MMMEKNDDGHDDDDDTRLAFSSRAYRSSSTVFFCPIQGLD